MTKVKKKKKRDWKLIAAWTFALVCVIASRWSEIAWCMFGVSLICLNVIYVGKLVK